MCAIRGGIGAKKLGSPRPLRIDTVPAFMQLLTLDGTANGI